MSPAIHKAMEIRFGGIQKSSLIDYPGKVSCVLFVQGCNFRCPFCHNPELVLPDEFMPRLDNDFVLNFLKNRQGLLDAVVISGGEPTLQAELPRFCKQLKDLGYCVKLDTNGSRPQVLEELLSAALIDYIAMDIKSTLPNYSLFTPNKSISDLIKRSIEIIMTHSPAYEFRTTCVKPIVSETIINDIAKSISNAQLYALQRFKKEKVLRPEFFKDSDNGFTDKEMEQLRTIAGQWVRKCLVR